MNGRAQNHSSQTDQIRGGLVSEFTHPQYDGHCIVNIPDSVCGWLDIPTFGMGPLAEGVHNNLDRTFKQVVMVIVDAVSYRHFQRWTQEDGPPFWKEILKDGHLAAITSISPSTTCAAMTSLWTGQPAGRHGVAGYEMWMKEYNMAVNMIVHGPTTFKGGADSLAQTGFDPTTFLPLPTLGTHLQAHGIQAHAFQHQSILHSGLSRTFLHDVELHGIHTPADMWISLRQLLESSPQQRMYITAYWGAIDRYFHHLGPGDERGPAEFISLTQQMVDQFLNALDPRAMEDTLVLVTADHGQIYTPHHPDYHLINHQKLSNMLHIHPTGENRLTYLHVRPGHIDAVREYISEHWPEQFVLYPSRELTQAGLFGPAPYHPRWYSRVGDLTMIAKGEAYLWWPRTENDLLGRHGGLSQDEMAVPLVTLPLG